MIESGWRRLRHFWRPSVREDVDDEVAFHFAMRVDQFVAQGMTRAHAEQMAREQFGDVADVREKLIGIDAHRRRRIDLLDSMDALLVDVRYAVRSLRAHWTLSLTIIATLAIAIGASTAVFSVVNAVLLRPLPYGDPDRLGFVNQYLRLRGVGGGGGVQLGNIPDVRQGATLLDIAGYATLGKQPFARPGGAPQPIMYAVVTTNIFDVMKLPVWRGRNFTYSDGTPLTPRQIALLGPVGSPPPPSVPPYIGIMGYDFWQRQFGGDPAIVGDTVALATRPVLIVGVASPNAKLHFPGSANPRIPDLWMAARADLEHASRVDGGLRLIGRMKPGVTVDAANRQLGQVAAALRERFPLRKSAGADLQFDPMKADLVSQVRPALVALMGAVIFLVLIACANAASLLFVRASQRERELAVRAAIGSSPWRIVRQLLVESTLLAAAAAIIGLVLAALGVPLFARLAPYNLPRLTDVRIDRAVLTFTLGVAFVSSIIAGLAPAIRVSRPPLTDVLRSNGRVASFGSTIRLRNAVIVGEVALSFALLVGGGLMVRSFVALLHVDRGFDPTGVLTFTLTNRIFSSPADRASFVHRVHDALARTPGVSAATMSLSLPLAGSAQGGRWGTTAALTDSTLFRQAAYCQVLPGYFETMRTTLLAGRTFTDSDDRADQHVIIIDDQTAARAFGDEPAVGKQLVVRIRTDTNEVFTVVGVVKRERRHLLVGDEPPAIYFPEAVTPNVGNTWAVRTAGDPAALTPAVRAAIASVDPALFINDLQPMSFFVDRAMAPTRFALVLIGIFATIAALLAAVGIYSVLSAFVGQRTSEIGIRMAFGAPTSSIFSLVIGHGLKLSAIGVAIGILVALAATRMMVSMLVSVRPADPVTFVAITGVFLLVAFVACWLPARRAAGLDPNAALREDAM